jgi:hypothetical protein
MRLRVKIKGGLARATHVKSMRKKTFAYVQHTGKPLGATTHLLPAATEAGERDICVVWVQSSINKIERERLGKIERENMNGDDSVFVYSIFT